MILMINLGMEIMKIIVDQAVFVSLITEFIEGVLVIINLGLRSDDWSCACGCLCHCLQNVITFMDVSAGQLSLRRHLRSQVF